DVASLAAGTLAVPLETTMSTFCRTSSATIAAARSLRPSPHRTLIATARPSIQPTARSRSTKAATRWFATEAVVGFKNPAAGGLGACFARAASGQAAAAPPRSVMNSRRFIRSPTHPANHSVGMMRAPCLPACSQAMMVQNAKKPRIGGAEFGRNHRGGAPHMRYRSTNMKLAPPVRSRWGGDDKNALFCRVLHTTTREGGTVVTRTRNGAPSMPLPLIPSIAVFRRKLAGFPIATFQAGETVLTAASTTGLMLREGAVAVLKEGV